MARLEDITAGTLVRGLTPAGPAKVRVAEWHGSDTLEVLFQVDGGSPREQLLSRADEAKLEIVSGERPFSFDADGAAFRLAAEAQRIRLAHLHDPYSAVDAATIRPLPHQIEAVYERMLPVHPLRFLLADDPGAGKTVMTGLYVRELVIRGALERCVIVAPGSLVEQWQDEMLSKFSLRFDILTRDQIEASATGNPFTERDRWIVRIDMLARDDELMARLRAAQWDLGVVDEAHKMAARYFGNELTKTKRFRVGEALRDTCRHLLLLTATPHSGKDEDFQLFMSLLDPDRFTGRLRSRRLGGVDDLMRRYTKEHLLTFEGTKLFPERRATTVRYELSPHETELYEAVTAYVTEGMNRAERLQAQHGQKARGLAVGFALTALQRRLASSPNAIVRSLERRVERLEDRRADAVAGHRLNPSTLRSVDFEDISDDDLAAEEFEALEDEAIDSAFTAETVAEIDAELAELRHLVGVARKLRASGSDRKWEELRGLLASEELRADTTPRKLIIFTEHKDTLTYLVDRIASYLGRPDEVVAIHGGLRRDERRRIQTAFTTDPNVRILVATDAAGEGVNLQRANLMVNYDLPWNPNRIEQRFGRIHRIGQTEVCHLWNLVATNTREGQVFERLLEKIETIRQRLGNDQVYDVLGDAVLETSLRDLLIDAIRHGDDPVVRSRMAEVIDATVGPRIEAVIDERALAAEILDTSRVSELRDQMERARAQRLQPGFVQAFFVSAFDALGGRIVERETGRFEITRVPGRLRSLDVEVAVGGPIAPAYERVTFEPDLIEVDHRPPAELIAPGHPLLRAVIAATGAEHNDALRVGTVLVDPDDPGTVPSLVVTLEHAIADGSGTEVSRRHQFVAIHPDGSIVDPGPAPYLDHRPASAEERVMLTGVIEADWLDSTAVEAARGYAIGHLAQGHFEETAGLVRHRVQRVRAAVEERLTAEIRHLDTVAAERRALEQAGKRRGGKTSGHAKAEADELERRLERRLRELDREADLVNLPPIITGAALVVPRGLIDELSGTRQVDHALDRRDEIDRRAVRAVLAAEERLGRDAREMTHNNPGYDIESRDPRTGDLWFIEVKGRIEGADTVNVKTRQIRQALNHPDRFILALVKVPSDVAADPDVRYLYGPFEGARPTFAQVSTNFDLDALWSVATDVGASGGGR